MITPLVPSGWRLSDELVIYEQPLNERIRMLLRLEFLLRRAHANLPVPSPWAARTVLDSILQVMDLLGRFDARQDLMKMLERHRQYLERIQRSPRADAKTVKSILDDIRETEDALHGHPAAFGHSLRRVEILNGLRQSAMVPGGQSGFEHPFLHFWLHRDAERREQDLTEWLSEFATVERALTLSLWLIRAGTEATACKAKGGFYNQTLNRGSDSQLVRVTLPVDSPWFANISGNPLRITVRFLTPSEDLERASQTSEDVEFNLTVCPGNPRHEISHG